MPQIAAGETIPQSVEIKVLSYSFLYYVIMSSVYVCLQSREHGRVRRGVGSAKRNIRQGKNKVSTGAAEM